MWKTLPADIYLLRKITSSLYKGLGNLSYGRSSREKGVQSQPGFRGRDEHPGLRTREPGHAAHPPPTYHLKQNPFAPAGPRAGGDASVPAAVPPPTADGRSVTRDWGRATSRSAPQLPHGRCGIFPAVPDRGSYSMAERFKMSKSRR